MQRCHESCHDFTSSRLHDFTASEAERNEPDHHASYLFDYVGQPWRTQFWVDNIMKTRYRTYPYGLPGNDDCGQMSAWLVLSTLGFYPVVPASGSYVAGAVLVRRATLQRADGTRLEIFPGQRPGVWLDGKRVDRVALRHTDLLHARRLVVGEE